MSRGATWVRLDDGLLHEDPLLAETEGGLWFLWFVCFDEDDPPEIVLQGLDWTRWKVESLLRRVGINAEVCGGPRRGDRAALPFVEGQPIAFVTSMAYDLRVLAPPPARLCIHEESTPVADGSSVMGTVLDFGAMQRR